MDAITLLLGISIFLSVGIFLFIVYRTRHIPDLNKEKELLDSRLKDLRETVDVRLHQGTEMMNKQMRSQFESSKKQIADITRELTEIKATGRETLSFTEQLQDLQRILKNPQRRGAVGEYVLEQVIANVLPPGSYEMQYSFKKGVRVDAVIFLRDKKLISIDAKFSLENYTKLLSGEIENVDQVEKQLKEDIKKRIQETAKYILPKENTLDYAFMFIPSESLYYDLLSQKIGAGDDSQNMLEYAFTKHKIIIVSPTTLLAYLQTVHLGLRSLQVEEHAQEILKRVGVLQTHLTKYAEAFHGIGKALGTTVNHYNKAEQQYDLIDKDIFKITGDGGTYTREVLARPHEEEQEKG